MSSSCIVPIITLKNFRPHTNADSLGLADALGYQVCVPLDSDGKFKYTENDLVVYFPADTLLSAEWSEKFGVTKLLGGKNHDRVKKVRLRGEPSFGLVVPLPEGLYAGEGDNIADFFGCTKFEPPIRPQAGDQAPYDSEIDPHFQKYTDIENGRLFLDVFTEDEEVYVSEKIHGSNLRIGIINGQVVAGSHSVRRTRPENVENSTYWYPHSLLNVRAFLEQHKNQNPIIYGEVFGGSIQSLHYGVQKGQGVGFRAFDIMLDGNYVGYNGFKSLCHVFEIKMVPELYVGPYSFQKVSELADGKSTMAEHIREGVVVKPLVERVDAKVGRAVLKYIGTEYSLSKNSDFKDV